MPEFTAREAADVAHCPERVLVDREDVVEVVLHLSHDVPEGRQEASEHAPRVHELERVVGSLGHPEDVEEGRLIDQIVPEGVVDRRGDDQEVGRARPYLDVGLCAAGHQAGGREIGGA